MKIKEIVHILDDWAPPGAAWERDNPGLQVGSIENEAGSILVCLDVTQEIINEAITKNCNLIISHHPLLFNSIKRIEPDNDTTSKIISALIKNDITLYSSHTNLDFCKNGVSFALAGRLGLGNCRFLKKMNSGQCKLSVFVPMENLESVSESLFSAGAGIIGEYSKCSFFSDGTGTFCGSENSKPVIGVKENFEKTPEVRLELVFPKWKRNSVIAALIKSHPYEEPAYDIYSLENSLENFGEGVIGEFSDSIDTDSFLSMVSNKLNQPALKFARGRQQSIAKVAVCGGAGSNLLSAAISQKADAFITADVKYHTFQEAAGRIWLIDAGHYETESPILPVICGLISEHFNTTGSGVSVVQSEISTNPIEIFK